MSPAWTKVVGHLELAADACIVAMVLLLLTLGFGLFYLLLPDSWLCRMAKWRGRHGK